MKELLLISSDVEDGEKVQNFAESLGFRVRSVTTLEAGKEWLEMRSFQALLIDDTLGEEASAEFMEFAWEKNLALAVGMFNLREELKNQGEAVLLGAKMLGGERAEIAVKNFLRSVPSSNTILNSDDLAVLFVEDLDSPRDIITTYIEALGYPKVTAVSNGEEALEHLRHAAKKFFCVITDINMPNCSGVELLRAIREDESTQHLPVIVLTAYPTARNLVDCMKEGATGFLTKPPRKKNLKTELDKAKRIFVTGQSPRICSTDNVDVLEDSIDEMY